MDTLFAVADKLEWNEEKIREYYKKYDYPEYWSKDISCPVCYDDVDLEDKNKNYFSLSCQHYLHKDCFKDYVVNMALKGISGVVAPCPRDCG